MSGCDMDDIAHHIVCAGDGLLEVSEVRLRRIISTEPITNIYHVEQTPFARGKFAAVRKVRHLATGVEYAAKFIRKRRRAQDTTREIGHEIAVLLQCARSPRVVKLHEVFDTRTEVVLILELAIGGELQVILDTDDCLPEATARRAMQQILEGLCHLHERNVAHLDLKPQNLLLTSNYPSQDAEVKLCDFGISRVIEAGVEVREILGTPDYVAPEILSYEPISLATDIWSVGVLAYVLLSGYTPFGGDTKQETYLNISQCELSFPSDIFADVSPIAREFICSTLVLDPRRRPTAKQCLEHSWLKNKLLLPIPLSVSCDSIPSPVDNPNKLIYSSEKLKPFTKSDSLTPASQRKSYNSLQVDILTPTTQRKSYPNLSTEKTRPNYKDNENLTPTSQRKYPSENSPSRNYSVSATCLSCAQCGATCCHLPLSRGTHNVAKSVMLDRGILC